MEVPFTAHVFREGGVFVAHSPELDVSSCGDTADEARKRIKDAVRGFLEVADEKGTLEKILEEAGYRSEGGEWIPPELVSTERLSVGID